jgi:hypothetical protein
MEGKQQLWRSGVAPIVAAVALSFGVAAVVDVANADRGEPKKKAARKSAAKKTPDIPAFAVVIRRPGTAVVVRDLRTGEDIGLPVAAPPGRVFHQVATEGGGAYVLSAYGRGQITFHRMTVKQDGRPAELTELSGLTVRGVSDRRSDLAVSADGRRLAYLSHGRGESRIDVLTVGSTERRRWTTRSPRRISSLSWAGDQLAFVWNSRQLRSLNVTAAPGGLKASRTVLRLPRGGAFAMLSAKGDAALVGVRANRSLSLEEFSTATGQRTKVLWTYRSLRATGLTQDHTGRYPLAVGPGGLEFPDPATGARQLPAPGVADAAW